RHLADRGGVSDALEKLLPFFKHHQAAQPPVEKWKFRPAFFGEFVLLEFGLLNPVFFVGIVWSVFAFRPLAKTTPVLLYFFVMGAPLFVFYLLWTIISRVQPNW